MSSSVEQTQNWEFEDLDPSYNENYRDEQEPTVGSEIGTSKKFKNIFFFKTQYNAVNKNGSFKLHLTTLGLNPNLHPITKRQNDGWIRQLMSRMVEGKVPNPARELGYYLLEEGVYLVNNPFSHYDLRNTSRMVSKRPNSQLPLTIINTSIRGPYGYEFVMRFKMEQVYTNPSSLFHLATAGVIQAIINANKNDPWFWNWSDEDAIIETLNLPSPCQQALRLHPV